ncbi:MAG TPA: GNAT family N-acetyltransferase [Beijerinckiaceae bacterium]
MSTALSVVRATSDDLPFILATERLDGYEALVGRWEEARHRTALSDPRHAYFIAREGGVAVGFGILRDWDSPERVTLVKRIAVTEPGQGRGRAFLTALADVAFLRTHVHRLWLGVFPENARARRAYEAAGFAAEGIARGSAYFGGVHRDELIMALLRPDWETRRRPIAPVPAAGS